MKKILASAALAIAVLWSMPSAAPGLTVQDKEYQATVTEGGKTLKLVGAGVRKKWGFKVYTMGAYSESGSCDAESIVGKDEAKYLRLVMLRNVSAEKMGNTISESFKEHMPAGGSAELKQQGETFKGYFKDECSEGTVLEFTYVPGTGTTLKQNGKVLGPVLTGSAFHHVLWDIYFGKDTCCSGLKEGILETCTAKGM